MSRVRITPPRPSPSENLEVMRLRGRHSRDRSGSAREASLVAASALSHVALTPLGPTVARTSVRPGAPPARELGPGGEKHGAPVPGDHPVVAARDPAVE